MPDRNDLDTISTEYPILLTRACGHCCTANGKALQIAGITASTPSPEGGSIGMKDGEPDGRLYDNAIDLVKPFIPVPDKEELKDMIRSAAKALNSYGIISVQTDDYSVFRSIPFGTILLYNRDFRRRDTVDSKQSPLSVSKDMRRIVR